jgi:serine protease
LLAEKCYTKGLRNSGTGSTAGIIAAINKCVEMGAKVISMSLGCNGCYSVVEEALMKEAYNEGVLVVAAAGSSGNTALSYPASYATVMSARAVASHSTTVKSRSQVLELVFYQLL